MFQKIIVAALSLSSCLAAEQSTGPNINGVTPDHGKDLACYIIAEDFVVYDLRPLQIIDHDVDYDFYD